MRAWIRVGLATVEDSVRFIGRILCSECAPHGIWTSRLYTFRGSTLATIQRGKAIISKDLQSGTDAY